MIAGVMLSTWTAIVLALAAVIASVRIARVVRGGGLSATRGASIIGLQCAIAVLLYFVLFPPDVVREAGVLTVLTADADARDARGVLVALPEYAGRAGERSPDLATALRRHPDTIELDVRGRGLEPRDRDAARGLAVRFDPAPLPRGLVELHLPPSLAVGQQRQLRGRVESMAQGHVELRDPAGTLLALARPDDAGHFDLPLLARAGGPVLFDLQVFDADSRLIDRAPIPVSATPGSTPRLLLLAGAPGAELRSLRRWAVDAGVDLDARVQIGRDIALGATTEIDAQALADADLLLLDERAWRDLAPARRSLVVDAVRAGLGVLLRIGDTLDDDDLASLAPLGFDVRNIVIDDASATLPGFAAADVTTGGVERPISLSRRPLQVTASDAATLLQSESGDPLAVWRSEGRGRIALWWLEDSYRLALEGDPALHASLWSGVFATLGRALGPGRIDIGTDHGVHHRRVICGLQGDARIQAPTGRTATAIDHDGCIALWPDQAGWHTARTEGHAVTFHVREPGIASGLDSAATRAATLELAALPQPRDTITRSSMPGSPWRFFPAWLVLCALAWWLERRHRRATVQPSRV